MLPTTSRPPFQSRPDPREDTFHLDDLDGEGLILPSDSPNGRDLAERVQTTQHRLAQLRQEAEALELEKRRFEELSRQQQQFMAGRAEIGEKLSRSLGQLDRETYEAQRRVEQLLVVKERFKHHLDAIDSLNPEQWNPEDLPHDLGRALGLIEEAQTEFAQGASLLGAGPAARTAPAAAPVPSATRLGPTATLPLELDRATFRFWLFCGLGFTVPLAATALLLFFAWLAVR